MSFFHDWFYNNIQLYQIQKYLNINNYIFLLDKSYYSINLYNDKNNKHISFNFINLKRKIDKCLQAKLQEYKYAINYMQSKYYNNFVKFKKIDGCKKVIV